MKSEAVNVVSWSQTSKAETVFGTAPACLGHLSLKKEKNPFPASPFTFRDLLLWSPPAFSLSCCFSLFLSSSLCSTCWLITNRMSSCNAEKGPVNRRTQKTSTEAPTQGRTCQASNSWDSATLCLIVLSSCWVRESFSWRTEASSLSRELHTQAGESIKRLITASVWHQSGRSMIGYFHTCALGQ